MRNSQLPRDDAGSDSVVGHLHYLVSDVIWQRPPVDEHSSKLIHSTLAQRGRHCATTNNNSFKKQVTLFMFLLIFFAFTLIIILHISKGSVVPNRRSRSLRDRMRPRPLEEAISHSRDPKVANSPHLDYS